uniref:Neurotensin receptor 1 n=1 Tax=Laticauda laticaudata TaxID=8630 RepID=A0A8C5RMH0_LATLA
GRKVAIASPTPSPAWKNKLGLGTHKSHSISPWGAGAGEPNHASQHNFFILSAGIPDERNLQSTVHYHLASLAFSDLLIFLLCMPIELYNFIWVHHPWAFGNNVCKCYYFLRDACTYATSLNIASLSVERYMAICHPFKAKSIMSRSRTKKFISCIWVASFLLAIPMILIMGEIYRIPQDPDSLVCTQIVDDSTLKIAIQVSLFACFYLFGICVCSWSPKTCTSSLNFAKQPSSICVKTVSHSGAFF